MPTRRSNCATLAKSIVLKDVQSPDRLFDETALFLHRVVSESAAEQTADARAAAQIPTKRCSGQEGAVVDDDARNIFALTQFAGKSRDGSAQRHERAAGDRNHRRNDPIRASC